MGWKQRLTHGYFDGAPKANPLADKPISDFERVENDKTLLSERLLPNFAKNIRGNDFTERLKVPENQRALQSFFDGVVPSDAADTPPAQREKSKKSGWLDISRNLVQPPKSTDDPYQIASQVSLVADPNPKVLRDDHPQTNEGYARYLGVANARNQKGSYDPVIVSYAAEGVFAADVPPPGTGGAFGGVRANFGRHDIVSVRVEKDVLFRNSHDQSNGASITELARGAWDWQAAKNLAPGERFFIDVGRTALSQGRSKYTAGLSSFVHDLGVSGEKEVVFVAEGSAWIEVRRGDLDTVTVSLKLRDRKTNPAKGKDQIKGVLAKGLNSAKEKVPMDDTFRFKVGGYLDVSLPEAVVRSVKSSIDVAAKDELRSMEERRRMMYSLLDHHADNANDKIAFTYSKERRSLDESVTAYDVVLRMNNPNAQKVFNQLTGSQREGERFIDVSGLEHAKLEDGVELVHNYASEASHRAITKVKNLFGFLKKSNGHRIEREQSQEGPEGLGVGIVETRDSRTSAFKFLGSERGAQSVGRVMEITDQKTGEKVEGVGVGWHFSATGHHCVDTLAQLMSFRSRATQSNRAIQRIENLFAHQKKLGRRKIFGMGVGGRGLEVDANLKLELNHKAVDRLLKAASDEKSRGEIYQAMAETYALTRGIQEPPKWPIKRYDREDLWGAMNRKGWLFNDGDTTFLQARKVLEILRKAAGTPNPSERAGLLSKAFDGLENELGFAAVLMDFAKDPDAPEDGIEFSCELKGVEVFNGDRVESLGKPTVEDAAEDEDAVAPESAIDVPAEGSVVLSAEIGPSTSPQPPIAAIAQTSTPSQTKPRSI